MDEWLWILLKRLRRYGEILKDSNRLDASGAWRETIYRYDGAKFLVLMRNGKIVGIW